MRKITSFLICLLLTLPMFAAANAPEDGGGDATGKKVVAELSETKRLVEYLQEFEETDWFGGKTYGQVTELEISGPMLDEDFKTLFKMSVIRKVDMAKATLVNQILPTYAFSMNAGLYDQGIDPLQEVILPANTLQISSAAFSGCRNLKKVNLESLTQLTKIGESAFMSTGLESVFIPKTCTSIGYMTAFAACMEMKDLVVEAGNPTYESYEGALYDKEKQLLILYPAQRPNAKVTIKEGCVEVMEASFSYQEHIEEVVLPSTLKTIAKDAFSYTSNLKKVNFPEGLETIMQGAFMKSAIEEVKLPEGIKALEFNTFSRNENLKNVTLPTALEVIPASVFEGCSALETVNFDKLTKLQLIDYKAFKDCASLLKVDLSNAPKEFVSFEVESFAGCTALQSVVFPASVTLVDDKAFRDCENMDIKPFPSTITHFGIESFFNTGITSLHIGAGIKSIGANAFGSCTKVKDVVVDLNDYCLLHNGMILSFDGSQIIYASPSISSEELDLSNISEIADNTFSGNTAVKRIILGSSLKRIGQGAFAGMTSLEEIDLSPAFELEYIGPKAFENTPAMRTVIFPDDNESEVEVDYWGTPMMIPFKMEVHANAFNGSGIEEVALPLQTNLLGTGAFSACENLTSADLSKISLTYLPDNLFKGCTMLEKVSLNNEVLSGIGRNVFDGCHKIKTITIPRLISYGITGKTFANSGIESFTVSEGNTTYKALDGVLVSMDETSLKAFPPAKKGEYVVPESVTKIEPAAFWGNPYLAKITLHDNIPLPGYNHMKGSFGSLVGLKEFEVSSTNPVYATIEGALYSKDKTILYAFAGDKTEVVLPEGLVTIAATAFQNNDLVESVIVPEGVKEVLFSAFTEASALTHVELPSTVEKLESCFTSSKNLKTMKVFAVNPPVADVYTFYEVPGIHVEVPAEGYDAYTTDKYWKVHTFSVLSSVNETLAQDEVVVYFANGTLNIESGVAVKSANVYSMTGQLLGSAAGESISLNGVAGQFIIVRVVLENGTAIVRKVAVR